MAEIGDQLDDLGAAAVSCHAADERAVDLHGIGRQALQIGERAVPDPEIVDGDLHPEIAQLRERAQDAIRFCHEHRLGDLEGKPLRRDLRALQRDRDHPRQLGVEEVADREVHRRLQRDIGLLPFGALRERHREHPRKKGLHQARPFGERDEFPGRDEAAAWMSPARESLDPHRLALAESDDGLVYDVELVGLERVAELGHERELVRALGILLFGVDR